jgi:t-SNARE complex subunit (syntaxin)
MQQQNLFTDLSYVFAQIHKKEEQIIQLKNLLHTTKNSINFNIKIDDFCINQDVIPYNLKMEIQMIISDSIHLLEREIQSLKIKFVC